MSNQNDAWGLEVGANAIKAIRLSRVGADLVVSDYDILPFKKVLSTPDLNVEEAIQVGLDQFLSRHSVAKSTVVLSVPGHMAFARFVKLPPVDPKKIGDIVKFEAVQQIPFPIDQVEWDYQQFSQADSPDVEVGIFAITKDRVMQFLSSYRNVGLTVDGITLSPLAVYNAMAYDLELKADSPGVMFMDIGTASTDVIIVEAGQIWLRTLPIGGNNFTEALVRAFKLSFPKAEKLKREAATSKYARQIFQAMRPVFADLVQEIQRSLGYYQSLNRDAKLTKIVGVGSTFRLPGMQKFLKQQLQMEVERPTGFKRIKIDGKQEADFAENAMNLATAYGLALQGLGLEAVNANLLPRHIVQQRVWGAKRPWFAAAAVVMLLIAIGAGARLVAEERAYAAQKAETAVKADRTLADARRLENDMKRVQTASDPRTKIENLRRILDYRDIWPKLMLDLDLAALSLMSDDRGNILQPQLLTTDYAAIAQVPWPQRRRIYISEVTAEYKLGGESGGTAMPGGRAPSAEPSTSGASYEEIFGKRRAQVQAAPTAPPPRSGGAAASPPTFLITLRGTSPNQDGVRLVGDRYIKWLKQNAERTDRPYRIIADEQLGNVGTVVATEAAGGSGAARPARTPLRGRAATPVAADTSKDTIPPPPPGRGPMPGDLSFEYRWKIQLVRPEDARQGEAAERERNRTRTRPGQPAATQPSASMTTQEDRL
jgi:type IV pilus assembly protein PilM